MQELFAALTRAVEGTPGIAMSAAFVWGVLSVVLSPCHIATIPLVVGFVDDQARGSPKRAFLVSTLFAMGILVTLAAVGAVAAAAGRVMGDAGPWGSWIVAVVLFVVGLYLLDVFPASRCGIGRGFLKGKGPLAALVLGLVFGLAVSPCSFAFAAPILGIVFRSAASDRAYGALLLALFAAGHCAVIVFAGTCTGAVQRYLNWNERSRGGAILRKICGVLVLLAGVYMIYRA